LEVATALTIRRLFLSSLGETGATLSPERDARGEFPPIRRKKKCILPNSARAAENQFVGVQSGLVDQISSLFGKAWHVMEHRFNRSELNRRH